MIHQLEERTHGAGRAKQNEISVTEVSPIGRIGHLGQRSATIHLDGSVLHPLRNLQIQSLTTELFERTGLAERFVLHRILASDGRPSFDFVSLESGICILRHGLLQARGLVLRTRRANKPHRVVKIIQTRLGNGQRCFRRLGAGTNVTHNALGVSSTPLLVWKIVQFLCLLRIASSKRGGKGLLVDPHRRSLAVSILWKLNTFHWSRRWFACGHGFH
mmetsp:Transcript_13743/g.37601  ORF Transcript_13743/g.37601 Transcript_13743/m.37601 type:complete len:217 (-) Transcript_13743:37-687(-)